MTSSIDSAAPRLEDVIGGSLLAKADYTGFDDFWEPFTYGVGPAGQHLASPTVEQRARVRDGCRWLRHTTLTWVERNFGYAVA